MFYVTQKTRPTNSEYEQRASPLYLARTKPEPHLSPSGRWCWRAWGRTEAPGTRPCPGSPPGWRCGWAGRRSGPARSPKRRTPPEPAACRGIPFALRRGRALSHTCPGCWGPLPSPTANLLFWSSPSSSPVGDIRDDVRGDVSIQHLGVN